MWLPLLLRQQLSVSRTKDCDVIAGAPRTTVVSVNERRLCWRDCRCSTSNSVVWMTEDCVDVVAGAPPMTTFPHSASWWPVQMTRPVAKCLSVFPPRVPTATPLLFPGPPPPPLSSPTHPASSLGLLPPRHLVPATPRLATEVSDCGS